MSSIAVTASATGTGVVSLVAPVTNTNRTLTLPDATGTVAVQGGTGVGKVLQVVNVQTGAVATGTTQIPNDDTIPQNTEGTEFITLAITPTSASSMLRVDFSIILGFTVSTGILNACLFRDSTANALAVATSQNVNNGGFSILCGSYYVAAGSTSTTTFKVRGGSPTGGTVTFNGAGSARYYGGVSNSFITITEVAA
jgi:hypothetical protein